MSRRLLALAAVGALAACGDDAAPAPTIAFRQPAALAIFDGYTIEDPARLRPYLVVANASRNDLTVVDATDDSPVASPIELRALVIPVADRPALLASARLGDGEADLLVAVSAGSSALELVRTWSPDNDVVDAERLDLGADVIAVAALPSAPPASPETPGRARIAVALAGAVGSATAEPPAVVVVEYVRGADKKAIGGGTVVARAPLGFQPLALATLPDDPAVDGVQSEIYVATRDPIATSATSEPVFGVAALPADLGGAPRVLDARAPTRLVAAARLRERAGASTASDASAFAAAPVPRVYAVLDEAGCGRARRIECGIVTLDPAKASPAPGDDAIPEDWAGRMPYRAPMRVPGRPLALAVAPPPAAAPGGTGAASEFMRLLAGPTERATTGVGAVASDDGRVYFLDLGRFETATAASPFVARNPGVASANIEDPNPAAGATNDELRLWFVAGPQAVTFPADGAAAAETTTITPGYTPTALFSVVHQGTLTDLARRRAQLGLSGAVRWLALQTGGGAAPHGDVVKVYHPVFGVRGDDATRGPQDEAVLGDVVVLEEGAAQVEGLDQPCEARVVSFLAPAAEFPGGALVLPGPGEVACLDDLYDPAPAAPLAVLATVRARGLVLTSPAGVLGRPTLGLEHRLEYPAGANEDTVAPECPRSLLDWDGRFTAGLPLCAEACRTACEQAVLARKARRIHNVSYPCEDQACRDRFPGVTFPEANGPVFAFTVDVQPCPGRQCSSVRDPAAARPALPRDISISTVPVNGVLDLFAGPASPGSPFHATGAIAFDRSREVGSFPGNAEAGYRFLFAYPADLVFDVSPSVNPVNANLIR